MIRCVRVVGVQPVALCEPASVRQRLERLEAKTQHLERVNEVGARRERGLAGKTIVITGAGGNFGREGSLFFASEGAFLAHAVIILLAQLLLDDCLCFALTQAATWLLSTLQLGRLPRQRHWWRPLAGVSSQWWRM